MANHRYTVTSDQASGEAVTVYSRLAIAASASATLSLILFTQLVDFGKESISLLNTYDFAVSTGAKTVLLALLSGLLYKVYARIASFYLWKYRPFRFILGINTPRVDGVWNTVVTKDEGGVRRGDFGVFEVVQTWRTIGITLDSEEVHSRSVSAAIDITGGRVSVEFQYIAERALGLNNNEERTHRGAAVLRLRLDRQHAETLPQLSYFTDHKEIGTFLLERVRRENPLIRFMLEVRTWWGSVIRS